MTTHEIAKLLLSRNDAPLSCVIEIATNLLDEHGNEIIAKVEGHDIVDLIQIEDRPHGTVMETVIHFETAVSREDGIDVVEVVKMEAQS